MTGLELFTISALLLTAGFAYAWVLFNAFRTSPVWGLLAFLVPLIAALFAFTHWDRCHRPVLLWLAAVGTLTAWSLADPGFWVR